MLQRQWLKGYLFSCGVATTRAFFTDRPRIDLETSGNTHRFFHLTPDRSELHHRHRGNSAQVMRPQQTDQPFSQFRQVVIKLLTQAAHQKGKALEQSLHVRVARARFIEIEHCRLFRVSAGKFFAGFQQVAHFSVVITQG